MTENHARSRLTPSSRKQSASSRYDLPEVSEIGPGAARRAMARARAKSILSSKLAKKGCHDL